MSPDWLDSLAWIVLAAITFVTLYLLDRWLNSGNECRVKQLFVYPIKSCAEVPVEQAIATDAGFCGDRVMQVTDAQGRFCTPREPANARLFHLKCTKPTEHGDVVLMAPSMNTPLNVNTKGPSGGELWPELTSEILCGNLRPPADQKELLQDLGDEVSEWLTTATGIPGARLRGIGPGYKRYVCLNPKQGDEPPRKRPAISLADEAPYLLTNVASLLDLNKRLGKRGADPVDMRRFRPNIVVEGLRPWEEDTWKRIRIGQVDFFVWQRCGRCAMTTIDRDSLKRCGEPLSTLSTFRERANGQRNFGMHLVPVDPTVKVAISASDKVVVVQYDQDRRAEWIKLHGRPNEASP